MAGRTSADRRPLEFGEGVLGFSKPARYMILRTAENVLAEVVTRDVPAVVPVRENPEPEIQPGLVRVTKSLVFGVRRGEV